MDYAIASNKDIMDIVLAIGGREIDPKLDKAD